VYGIAAGGCGREVQQVPPCTLCSAFDRRRDLYLARFIVGTAEASVQSVKPLPGLKAGLPVQAGGMLGMGLGKAALDPETGHHTLAGVFVRPLSC
jgi:hypothetical protein